MKLLVNSSMAMNIIWDFVNTGIQSVFLWIDSVVYWFASQCYQLFIKLAGARIFEDNFFANFANRIYVVLGVFMLFYLAYALLTAIVDPEKLTKGDKGVGKMATNLIVSLVILGFLPTIFSYAYRLQNYILASNVIGSLILGTPVQEVTEENDNTQMLEYGDVLSFTILNTFLNPDNINFNVSQDSFGNDYTWYNFKADVLERGDYSAMPNMGKAVSTGVNALNGESAGSTVRIDYKVIISTAAGVFLIYIMLSFTLDLGVRVAKFAFYQLVAPIPVIMRVLPSKKSVFDKWLKQTLSVYFEVFVRVAIMYIAIYFINTIANTDSEALKKFWEGGLQGKLALTIIIMGILAFAKQAPKMISDILGIDTGGLKLGIKDKLKAGGFFAVGSAVGTAVTSRFNPFAIARGWNKGMKDGNFKAIGEEAALRNKVLAERANGSTWAGRRMNDVRGFFGFDTTADAAERRIERTTGYNMDHIENMYNENGTIKSSRTISKDDLTKSYIESRKQELTARNASVDETIKQMKADKEIDNQLLTMSKDVLDASKEKINKVDSDYIGTLSNAGYGAFQGNLTQMRDFVQQLEANNIPDKSKFTDQNAYQESLRNHAKIISDYKAEIEKQEKEMTSSWITKVMNSEEPNSVDLKTATAVAKLKNMADLAGVTLNEKDGSAIASLKKKEDSIMNALNVEVSNLEQSKVYVNQELSSLNQIEAHRKQDVESQKQTQEHRARVADKNVKGGGK